MEGGPNVTLRASVLVGDGAPRRIGRASPGLRVIAWIVCSAVSVAMMASQAWAGVVGRQHVTAILRVRPTSGPEGTLVQVRGRGMPFTGCLAVRLEFHDAA